MATNVRQTTVFCRYKSNFLHIVVNIVRQRQTFAKSVSANDIIN